MSVWGRSRRLTALRPAWQAAKDSGRGDKYGDDPLGGWLTDDLVVRADFDRLQAYDLVTGAVRWTWPVPGREVLATASEDAREGIALVLHHDDGSLSSESTVVAVDLATGEPRWSRNHRGFDFFHPTSPHTSLGAWRITRFTDKHVTSADPEDGTVLWRTPLPSDGRVDAWIMFADPVVVVSEGSGRRAERRISVFDDDGNVTASFPLPAPYTEITLPATVVNGTLVARLVHPGDDSSDQDQWIGGFDLATGELRWVWRTFLSPNSLLSHRDRLLVLDGLGTRVTVLDTHDGSVLATRKLRGTQSGLLRMAGDQLAVISGGGRDIPLRLFHWR